MTSPVSTHNKEESMRAQYARILSQEEADLRRFIEPKAMNIKALGEKTLLKFHGRRLVCKIEDLYNLNEDYILSRHLTKQANLDKIKYAILMTPSIPLTNVIYALNIPTVGLEHAEELARYFGTLEELMKDSAAVYEVPVISTWVKDSVAEWIDKPRSQEVVKFLLSRRVGKLPYEDPRKGKPFEGQRWYISEQDVNTLDLRKKLKKFGAKVSTVWSKRLDHAVFVNLPTDHQMDGALAYGITIHTLPEAQEIVESVRKEQTDKITDTLVKRIRTKR